MEMELDDESSDELINSLERHFGSLPDYRRQGSVSYRLVDILFIALCAIICGANTLKAVAVYASKKREWLTKILETDEVPSYTTFWTVFALLNPVVLEECFVSWVQSKFILNNGDVVSIDGKAQRGTAKKGHPNSFVHIVSAWAANSHLTLGQLKVDGKSNEITAIPKLLDIIDIEGSIVTIDAMGCQTEIAKKIIDKGADYIFSLKGNQGLLSDEIENYFRQAEDINYDGIKIDAIASKCCGHGRIERREIYVTDEIEWLPQKSNWKGLSSIIFVNSTRICEGKTTVERRYYISSLPAIALKMGDAIRKHWGIENQAHWILDVAFKEDVLKADAVNIAENTSLLRRIALNMLKQEKSLKAGIEIKRQAAGWDNAYLLRIIGVKFFS